MELMEINGNWWKIMELVEIICWKSTNIEAKMAKNPKVTHKYFFFFFFDLHQPMTCRLADGKNQYVLSNKTNLQKETFNR